MWKKWIYFYYGVIFDHMFKFDYIVWSFSDMYEVDTKIAKKKVECVKISLFKFYN